MPRVTRSNSIQEVKEEVVVSDEEVVDSKNDISPAQKAVSSNKAKTLSQYVMIAPENLCKEEFRIVKLRHPKTDAGCLYAFSKGDKSVYEVNQFEEAKRSWFIDDSVQSDGSLFFTTIVDPLFLIIPYLSKAKHTSPIDQLIIDSDFSDASRLTNCVNKEKLELIADCKETSSFQAWKYNEEKVKLWLEKKVTKLSNHLKEKNFNVTQSAISSNYVKSTVTEVPESTYKRYAFGIISEYLSDHLCNLLEKHLDLPAVVKISEEQPQGPPAKKRKIGDKVLEPTEDYSKDVKHSSSKEKVLVTAKEKALASAAKGTKSISSFFSKK